MNRLEQLAAHRGWKQFLLTAVVLAILAARVPLLWRTGEFVAEDGWVFFADAWNHSFSESLLLPYAGYFHLLPRLIAGLCLGLPIASQPYAYAGIGLTLNAAILAIFYLPVFRRLAPSDLLRAMMVLLLALAPNAQNLGLILGLHWYLAFGLCLVLITPAPASALGQALLALAMIVAVWSSPSAFVLAPFTLAAWLRDHDWANRLKLGVMLGAVLLVAVFVVMLRVDHADRTGSFQTLDLPLALEHLVLRGWLGVGLLGPRLAGMLPPVVLDVFGGLALGAIVAGIWRYRDREFTLPVATLLATAVAMLLLSLMRTAYVAELARLPLPIHTRYLTAPTLLLYLSLGVAGAQLLTRTSFLTSLAVLATVLITALPGQNHWARAATVFHLRDAVPAIEQFSRQGGPASLYIPSDIPYWGPVLEKEGGLVVPPDVGLAEAIGAKAEQPEHYTSWLGRFTTAPAHWIDHETRGRLRFTGIERGRVFFRDPADRLLFTSPL
ncbi:MAG TPA: hypothetical protein VF388_06040, partial [Lacunisphaera sp.]